MEGRLRSHIDQLLMYENQQKQLEARNSVPVDELNQKVADSFSEEGNLTPSKNETEHGFLVQLLYWFKQTFRWVDAPPCDDCNGQTVAQGMGRPLHEERRHLAFQVEVYRCNLCSKVTRFPRYNDPSKLVETRKGRCGEWANCFTFYCRAFGYETRMIVDFTDHVWTVFFSTPGKSRLQFLLVLEPVLHEFFLTWNNENLYRWMHLDCCEAVYDRPLLYEQGWGKKLSYVIAFSIDGVFDVTKRYTRNWDEVVSRRHLTTEPVLKTIVIRLTREIRRDFSPEMLSVLEDRDKIEAEEIERDYRSKDDESTP